MSRKRTFYNRLPDLTDAMLDTLMDLLEQEEAAEYDYIMAQAPAYERRFVTFDLDAWEWVEL